MAYTDTKVWNVYLKRKANSHNGPNDVSITRQFTNVRTGARVDNYRKMIDAGIQAGSPYSMDKYRFKVADSSFKSDYQLKVPPYTNYFHSFEGSSVDLNSLSHVIGVTAEMEAKALTKVYTSIRANKTHMNGMNMVGELRETIRMMRRPAESLVDLAFKLLRRESKRITEIQKIRNKKQRRLAIAKAVAGTNLEINFGWGPLLSEIRALAETAARYELKPPSRDRIKHSATALGKSETIINKYSVIPNLLCFASGRNITKTEASVQYIVGMETSTRAHFGALKRLRDLTGFTAENIIPTIYELTPWSWAVDYFSNLGDIIEAGTTDTSDVKWIVKTIRQSTDILYHRTLENPKQNIEASGPYWYKSHSGTLSAVTGNRTTLSRSIPISLGIPPLVLTHPGGSFKKMSNLLSVLVLRSKSARF